MVRVGTLLAPRARLLLRPGQIGGDRDDAGHPLDELPDERGLGLRVDMTLDRHLALFDRDANSLGRDPERARDQVLRDLAGDLRSEEHTSELQSLRHLVCRLLLEKKKTTTTQIIA